MTARDIYKNALANVSQVETENERWDEFALSWVNQAICNIWLQCTDRFVTGDWQIHDNDPPEVDDLDEEINMRHAYKLALVYSVTASLWEDAGEQYKAQDYYNRALTACRAAEWVETEQVVDVYD